MEKKVVFGPTASFYDDAGNDRFQVVEEADGLFFEFIDKDSKQLIGCTLVAPQLDKLILTLMEQRSRIRGDTPDPFSPDRIKQELAMCTRYSANQPVVTDTGLVTELAYKFWSVHPREIDEFLVTHPMPENYKGGGRAWFFEHHMRGLLAAERAEKEELDAECRVLAKRCIEKDARIKELEETKAVIAADKKTLLDLAATNGDKVTALEAKLAAAEKNAATWEANFKALNAKTARSSLGKG